MIEYRKATTDDIAALTRMRVSMLCDDASYTDEFKEKLRANTLQYMFDGLNAGSFIAWIAAQNEEIIAMCGLTFFTLPPNDWCPSGKTAYISNMYTLPGFRKQGIAGKLLSLIVDEAKMNGCERILLNTTDMGKPLYKDYGFGDSPTAMAYYPYL